MARKAESLDTLLAQIDGASPKRDKSSDGWIADENHSPTSDHQPNAAGVVTAIDITNDPVHGVVARRIAEQLVASRDRRIENLISDGQIISSTVQPWVWRPYSGPNAHRSHVHLSVHNEPELYDDPRLWAITLGAAQPTRAGMFTSITATVFGGPSDAMSGTQTAYGSLVAPGWHNRPGVALPSRFSERPLPQVRVIHNGKSIVCPVIDVGPWNTSDRYWDTGARPQAETGTDKTGRHTNKAGIDLTPAAAALIGLPGKGLVDWEFVGAKALDGEVLEPLPKPTPAEAQSPLMLILLLSLLTKEKPPVNNEPTQGQAAPDILKVLLPLILQSAISGKPLDMNALLPALLQGMTGVQLALPPPAPVNPEPPQLAAPQGMNDMLLPLLLQLLGGKPAAPATPAPPVQPVVVAAPPVDPTVKPVVGTSALALMFGSILQTLGVVGTPFGIGEAPTATGTLTTLIPLIAGVAGAFGGFGPLLNIGLKLFSGFTTPAK